MSRKMGFQITVRPSNLRLGHQREGIAPIEFLVYLPIYIVFILVTVWVARIRLAEMEAASIAAFEVQSQVAESDQHQQLPEHANWNDLDAEALRQLVDGFHRGLSLASGSVRHKGSADTGEGVPDVIEPLGSVENVNEQLTHSWEDLVFDFPDNAAEQRQLTLPSVIRGIVPRFGDLAAFTALDNFSGGSSAASLSGLSSLGRRAIQSASRIREESQKLEASIRETTQQIDMLRGEEFPDWGKIRELENKRRELTDYLAKLNKGLEHVTDALRIRERVEIAESGAAD